MNLSRAALLVLLIAGGALAASEGHAEHHAPSIADLFWPVLNFSLFVGLLARFVWPTVKRSVAERRSGIEKEIVEADHSLTESRAALAEIERQRTGESEHRERLLAELRDEGERERRALIEAARRSGERMREDARRLGETEAGRAVLDIRRRVAAEAARRAEEEVRRRLGAEDERRFVSEFLDQLDREASQ